MTPRITGFNSIRARVTAAFSLATAALMLLAGGGLAWYARYDTEHNADALLSAAAQKVKREFKPNSEEDQLAELMEDESDLTSVAVSMMIVDGRGGILHHSRSRIPVWPHTPQDGWRVAVLPIGPNATVVVGMPWRDTERNLRKQALFLALLCLIIFLAVTAGAWLVIGQSLSPIRLLAQQARAATTDSLRVQLVPSSQDAEIVELVTTLNGLLGRLSEAAAAKGRFYAAASHELRTPLQALSGHLELALTRPRASEEYLAVVQEAHAQTRRLTTLVRDLLLLNQLDSALPPASETLDPAEAAAQALAQLAPLLAERRLQLEANLDSAAEILAPPTHVEMLTRNLLENAVKYAREGGVVRVDFTDGGATLEIFNATDPLPDWDERKLFEPFYRLDASRNSKTGGNGLGLAICEAIATANGWRISLQQVTGGVLARVVFAENSRS